jgi:hypothetical protein
LEWRYGRPFADDVFRELALQAIRRPIGHVT